MSTFATLATLLLRQLDAEKAHRLALHSLALGLTGTAPADDPALGVDLLGLNFPNPIGLAAGFDKDARAIGALGRLGFGHVETGTVTPRPQPGNPRPRLFRLTQDRAIINRMGFNGCGIDRFCQNLARSRSLASSRRPPAPLGVNLGINKTGADPLRDYPALVARVKPYADYVTINLSSPNTPGLRDLQTADTLRALLKAIDARTPERPPLLIKLSPDLDDCAFEPILDAALEGGAQGLILTNTTLARDPRLADRQAAEAGGLSGRPLAQRSRDVLAHVSTLNKGRLALISCGGIETGRDVLERIRMGADMVQIYTAFIYEGPALLARLKRELLAALKQEGCHTLAEIRKAAKR